MSDAKAASNDDDECSTVRNEKGLKAFETGEKSARPHGEQGQQSEAVGRRPEQLNGEQMSEFKEQMNEDERTNEQQHPQSNDTLMKLDYEKGTASRELKTDQNQLESFINSSDKDANGMTNGTNGAHSGSMSNDEAAAAVANECRKDDRNDDCTQDRNAKSIMKSKVSGSKNTSSKLNGRLSGKHLISNPMHRANSVGENINEFKLARDGRSKGTQVKRSASETVLHFDDYDVAADDELEEDDEYEQSSDRLSFRNFNKKHFDKRHADKHANSADEAKSISTAANSIGNEDDSPLILSANLSFNHQNSSYCLDTYSFKKEQLSQARRMPDQVLDFFSSDEQSLIEQNQSSKQQQSLLNEPVLSGPMLDLDTQTEEQASDREDETNSSNQVDLQDLKRKLERDVLMPTTAQTQFSKEKAHFERENELLNNPAINENHYNLCPTDDELESAPETPNAADDCRPADDSVQQPDDANCQNDYAHSDNYPNDDGSNYDGNFQSATSSDFENELANHGRISLQQQRHHITSLENLFSLETIEEQDEEDYSLKDQSSLRSNVSQQVGASRPQTIDSHCSTSNPASQEDATNEDVSNAELSNAEFSNGDLSNIERSIPSDRSEEMAEERLRTANSTRGDTEQLINNIYRQVCFEEDSLNDGPAVEPSEASESVDYKRYQTFKRDISLEDDQTLSNGQLLSNDCDSLQEDDDHFNSLSECMVDENVTIDDQQMVLIKRPTNEPSSPINAKPIASSRARIVKPVQTKPSQARASQPIRPIQAVRPTKLANSNSSGTTNRSGQADKQANKKQPLAKPEICKRSSLISKNIEQLDKSKKRVGSMMQFGGKIEPRSRVSDLVLKSPKIIKSTIAAVPPKTSPISSMNGSAKLNLITRELGESGVHMDQLIEENQSVIPMAKHRAEHRTERLNGSPPVKNRKFTNSSGSSHLSAEGSSGVESGPSSDDIDQPNGKQAANRSPDLPASSRTKSVRQTRPLLSYVEQKAANEAAKCETLNFEKDDETNNETNNENRRNELSKSRSMYNVESRRYDHLTTDHRLSSEEFKRRRRSYEVNLDCLEAEHSSAGGRGLKDLRRKSTNYLLNASFNALSNEDIGKIKRELIRRSEERLARFEASISSRSNSAINSVNNSIVESLPTNSHRSPHRSPHHSRAKSQNSIDDYDDGSVNHSKSSDENLDDYQNKRISRKDINEKWRETLKRSDSLDSLNSIKSINSLGSLNYEDLSNLKGISRKRIKSSNYLNDEAGLRAQTSEDEYDNLINVDHYVKQNSNHPPTLYITH